MIKSSKIIIVPAGFFVFLSRIVLPSWEESIHKTNTVYDFRPHKQNDDVQISA